MGRIRSRDTKPELFVRKILHSQGYRFTVGAPNNKKLPGKPDIVLPKYRLAIFVHGCFWHQCPLCREGRIPSSRKDYWVPKLRGNQYRDARNQKLLKEKGWRVMIIWECQTKAEDRVLECLGEFLEVEPRKKVD